MPASFCARFPLNLLHPDFLPKRANLNLNLQGRFDSANHYVKASYQTPYPDGHKRVGHRPPQEITHRRRIGTLEETYKNHGVNIRFRPTFRILISA